MLPKKIIAQYNTIVEQTNSPGEIARISSIINNMSQNIYVNFFARYKLSPEIFNNAARRQL